MRWDDVNARARGLATHLLDRSALAGLSAAPDWPAFVSRVTALGYPLDLASGATLDPPAFDRAVSLVASKRIHLLGRWLSARQGVLAVVLEDEEFRTVRALLRGAAEGASPSARLRASTPTPHLAMRALERMARAASVPELVRELLRLGHPAGRAWQDTLRQASAPDLRQLEWAAGPSLHRACRARGAGRRAGGAVVRLRTGQPGKRVDAAPGRPARIRERGGSRFPPGRSASHPGAFCAASRRARRGSPAAGAAAAPRRDRTRYRPRRRAVRAFPRSSSVRRRPGSPGSAAWPGAIPSVRRWFSRCSSGFARRRGRSGPSRGAWRSAPRPGRWHG